ncbi:MAG: hypothetical protein LBL82_03510 [Oscillospiraceae bacterium]|jgi:hypothetical protein|nr:hypothetical protein [Oscillospiraceae bacterium]
MNIYSWADKQFNSSPKYETGFTQLLGCVPYFVEQNDWNMVDFRRQKIMDFMRVSLDIFKKTLFSDDDPIIKSWLINETPSSIGINYHQSLQEQHFSLPVFYRTDESSLGKIMEIQCPGSLWGELQLSYEYAHTQFPTINIPSPAKAFANQLTEYLGRQPITHHLLDDATAQSGMRYFIEKTRPEIKYANIDNGVRPENCNFVRNHFYWGLCSEIYFLNRLPRIGIDLFYDLPPHVLFSQKATLVLPFWSKTRHYFSDDIRDIINFSVPLLPTGIELETGLVSISEFAKLPRKKRCYYLKYAGSKVSSNWGGQAVYRLSNLSSENCLALFNKCLERYDGGEIWLIQKEDTKDDTISYYDLDSTKKEKKLRLKLSSFYGPNSCIGVLAMHNDFYKVHGKNDTVISFVMPNI